MAPSERRLMQKALRLAERGYGRVEPNPLVGALVVQDGGVVAQGYHATYGGPHAEIVALRAAAEAARGATLYVTLEPCAHHGKTPPCTDAILEAGIRKVVFAASDPDPHASGGARVLEAAGVEVVGGLEETAARSLNAPFFHLHERGGCYAVLKLAMTLDGKLSRRRGEPTRITGPAARRAVHRLRGGFDGILVGIGTVLADDPSLTVRGVPAPRAAPNRIVLDTQARLPLEARLLADAESAPVWVFTSHEAPRVRTEALEARGARVFQVPASTDALDVRAVVDRLAEHGVRRVLCEGGARVAVSFLSADVIERLHLFFAPRIFGTGVDAFPFTRAADAPDGWRLMRTRRYGHDVLLTLDRDRNEA